MIVLLHALVLLLSSVRAATYESVTWIYPPGCEYCNTSLQIRYGDAMNVVWTSTWHAEHDQNSLELWCGQDNISPFQVTVPNSGNHTVHLENLNFGQDSLPLQCHYSLGVGQYTGNGSSQFEVTSQDPNLAPVTWSATASPSSTVPSTSSPTGASTTPASDNSSGSSTQSAAAQTSSPSGLSTGAKAGIGVGSVIGGLAILVALGIIIFGTRRRRKQHQHQHQQQDTTSAEKTSFPSSPSDDVTVQGPHGLYSRKPELDAEQTKYEAAGTGEGQEKWQQQQVKELDAADSNNVALRAELEADGATHQLG